MNGPAQPRADSRQSATALVDEAVHRLRLAPLGTIAIYYAGSLPFVLALLYYWGDMSHAADAGPRGPGAALVVAVAFLLMKTAQAVFAANLRAHFARQPVPRWTPARLGRVLLIQTGWHAPGLFLLQAAAALILPTGWVYAFYQNVTALGGGEAGITGREIGRQAWRQALARPRVNHRGLSILCGLGFFAWLALLVAAVVGPQLVQMFTGEENVFTQDVGSLFNTTLLLVSGALVYLALDPLVKTFYALRCFYEDAARTGEDLLSELRALPPVDASGLAGATATPARRAAAALPWVGLLLALTWTMTAAATAATVTPAAPLPVPGGSPAPAILPAARPSTVSPAALDRSIHQVLTRREFAWRAPRARESAARGHQGWVDRLVAAGTGYLRDSFQSARHFIAALRRWLRRDQPPSPSEPSGGPIDAGVLHMPLTCLLCTLLAGAIAFLLWAVWRGRRLRGGVATCALPAAAARALPPDLAAEDLLATHLPEEEWLLLARQLWSAGDRRLALRALYLSLLAGLGARGLLVIARHKSNRDYLQELRRRARDRPDLPAIFGRNVGAFERVWYGSHPADDGLLATFETDRALVLADRPAGIGAE